MSIVGGEALTEALKRPAARMRGSRSKNLARSAAWCFRPIASPASLSVSRASAGAPSDLARAQKIAADYAAGLGISGDDAAVLAGAADDLVITTDAIVGPEAVMRGVIAARKSGVVAGAGAAKLAFQLLDPSVVVTVAVFSTWPAVTSPAVTT